jgi:hypothetical protein
MQFTQRVGILDRNLGRELTAPFASPNLLAPGPALHITAAFQLDQITTIAQNRPVVQKSFYVIHSIFDVSHT